jgi:hypothetical protein
MNSTHILPQLTICFPQGAGGHWLNTVISCCINDTDWSLRSSVNWHKSYSKNIGIAHECDTDNSVLYIASEHARYNFWRLYCYKHIINELSYQRQGNTRIVKSPYINSNNYSDHIEWLLNQARFIQNQMYSGTFRIEWTDLFKSPEQAWQVIVKFLDFNCYHNYKNLDFFICAVNDYKQTCKIQNTINFKHRLFCIWALAFFQENKISAPCNVFDILNTRQLMHWIEQNKEPLIEYTLNNSYTL